jgi:Lrp/AsnC family leucine-responsive transcriptional regulator
MVAGEVRSILILNIADMDEYSELADRLFNEDDNVSEFTSLMVMSPFK